MTKVMTPEQIVAKLEKTRQSILAHRARGLGLGENGNINARGCDLCDRYDDLKKMLTQNDRESYAIWKEYCDRHGSDYRHGGHDMFA